MTTTTYTHTVGDAMREAHDRRAEGYRPVDMTGIKPRRDLPKRDRKHSVSHRSYR